MRFVLFILFFIYFYCEIELFFIVANSIGFFLALMGIIATSILGFSLVKTQGIQNFSIMLQKLANNQSAKNEMVKSVSLLFAGFFLLIPGFLTDILGAILLIPSVQEYFIKFVISKIPIKAKLVSSKHSYKTDDIIEGEYEHKDDE